MFYTEYIWVAASWNYTVSNVSRGTPRLWYTFRSASNTLDTKSVVKINYHIPIASATKLKKHKVPSELTQTYF